MRVFPALENIQKNIVIAGGTDVTILAVTKTRAPDKINSLWDHGITIIGENRVQELMEKIPSLNPQFKRHFIGQLQKNKVKYIASCVDMIQSIDRMALADEVERQMAKINRVMPILIEVSAANEAQKGGVPLEKLEVLARYCAKLPHLRVEGLMAVMPIGDSMSVRPYMRRVRQAFDSLARLRIPGVAMKTLSMGMSDDYVIAVEEGANLVRIGTALFQE